MKSHCFHSWLAAGTTKLSKEEINTFETSAKNKHITNDNRIAISIVDQNNPFNMASIKGKVIVPFSHLLV